MILEGLLGWYRMVVLCVNPGWDGSRLQHRRIAVLSTYQNYLFRYLVKPQIICL